MAFYDRRSCNPKAVNTRTEQWLCLFCLKIRGINLTYPAGFKSLTVLVNNNNNNNNNNNKCTICLLDRRLTYDSFRE